MTVRHADEPVRVVVIGVGAGVFRDLHRPALAATPALQVVGATDVNPEAGRARAAELDCPFFADHRTLLEQTRPDLAVIVTPHPFHAPIAIDCLNAGAHALVEKPIAVQVAEADAMVDAARANGRLLAVNFQHRTRPEIRTANRLIQGGRLGEIQRVELAAMWTRTACYYAQSDWRGTWRGEGGGVLMNQSPHNLDLLCHLAGQPRRVFGWTRTLLHHIETEDTAAGLLEWDNGALGSVFVSTAQAGEPERLAISGTRGSLELRRGTLRVEIADTDLREFVATSTNPYGKLTLHPLDLELELHLDSPTAASAGPGAPGSAEAADGAGTGTGAASASGAATVTGPDSVTAAAGSASAAGSAGSTGTVTSAGTGPGVTSTGTVPAAAGSPAAAGAAGSAAAAGAAGSAAVRPGATVVAEKGGDHRAIYANLVQAIRGHAALVADGVSARQPLELANALIYSSATSQQVELPLDRAAYADLLDRLRSAQI